MTVIREVRARLRRRILISYRLDPDVASGLLPDGFRPHLVDGAAVAGICILGLDGISPTWSRGRWGLRSENAAHRIAVEWDEEGETRHGVFIVARHSSAWHPVLFGGRLFPGVHRRGRVSVEPVELACAGWAADAASIVSVRSSFFDGLPEGSAVLDSAIVMRDLPLTLSA